MSAPLETSVLVVGAGPTGLMLANQLARRGVAVSLVDRNPGPSLRTKALGVQARTLEIYDRLGIADTALDLGTRATGANLWADGRRTARIPLGDIGSDLSPYPFLLILGQDDNERLLGDALRHHGIEPQWGAELVALEQATDRVLATLKLADGTLRQVSAGWIAGCDGARSTVRRLRNIGFPGAPYEHVFFVADTIAAGPMVPNELNVFLWRGGFHLFFPMRGADHWRVVAILPPALRGRDDVDFNAVVPVLRAEVGPELSFQGCNWFSTYRIHHRRADRFRDGRCFLLGDAAHIHSPVGAQGMNTGLQDAYNLGWKLSLVASGRAGPQLLDSYAVEREPVAERLLATTDRAFSLIVSENWLAGLFRTRILARVAAFAMRRERLRRLAFRTVSQIGIHYRGSPLSAAPAGLPPPAPQAGDRFPWLRLQFRSNPHVEDLFGRLDDLRFNLLLFGQAPAAEFPDLICVHAVADSPANNRELARVGVPNPSFFLLRPDGHIALSGTKFDPAAISRYFSGVLSLVAKSS